MTVTGPAEAAVRPPSCWKAVLLPPALGRCDSWPLCVMPAGAHVLAQPAALWTLTWRRTWGWFLVLGPCWVLQNSLGAVFGETQVRIAVGCGSLGWNGVLAAREYVTSLQSGRAVSLAASRRAPAVRVLADPRGLCCLAGFAEGPGSSFPGS